MTRRMKDSGIEWIGEIPEDWEVLRLKSLTTEIQGGIWGTEAQGDENDIACMRIADFDRTKLRFKDMNHTIRNLDKSKQKKYLLEHEDLLIEKSGGGEKQPVGFVVMYDLNFPAIYTNFMAKIGVNYKLAEPNFLRYIFASLYYANINLRSIKQTTGIQNLDTDSYMSEVIAVPPVSQQKSIADFLDKKTGEIDKIISKTKEAIEEYKKYKQSLITETVTKGLDKNAPMKDSGIEWIGDIPEHWEVIRMKNIATSFGGITYSPINICDKEDGGILVLRSSNVQQGKLDFSDSVYVDIDVNEKYIVKEGDILVCSRNGSRNLIGKNVLIDDDYGYTFGAFMTIVRTKLYPFIHYFLNSNIFKAQSSLFLTSTVNQLTIGVFNNMELVLPSEEEQEEIVAYLDKKTGQIDNIISTKEKLLEEMEAYKKSLIYETVTGKREVE